MAPPPAPVRRALGRNLAIFVLAAVIVAVTAIVLRTRSVPVVQVATASVSSGAAEEGRAGGATSVTANGYVVARTKASVSAKTAGRLAFLGVSEGSYVNRGEVIARLDNADYQASVSQAQANVAAADASVIEATSDRDQLARDAQSHQRDPRAQREPRCRRRISRRRRVAPRRPTRGAMPRTPGSGAPKRGSGWPRRTTRTPIIRAPFTGTVLRKDAEVGEVVAPSVGGGLTRGAVVTMADLSTLEVEVDVNEAYIGRIRRRRAGAHHARRVSRTRAFRGAVRQVVPTADRQRATVQVKVSILDHDPRILPEMGAKVDFLEPEQRAPRLAHRARRSIRIPAAAVKTDGGASVVWLVRDGQLTRAPGDDGPVSGGFLEVRSGLSGGEQLLVGGVESRRME